MVRPRLLSCLLLLPLAACFPVLDLEAPMDTPGGTGGERGWARLAGGRAVRSPGGPSPWPGAPRPHALQVVAQELLLSGRARTGIRLRSERQEEGPGAAGLLRAEGDQAGSPLGTLAEELSGYSRKKGGFHFRFGRR
ncbi:orexigenic neuropeptide QRFP [Pipistrellus kuhlii]|uniref:Pyroglutamylated RFamide peptide n=1 Tax=Pipistrellus kuhlii TaxID=59472 RepID=A0A7J7S3W8_PIPKU|nr:orexigenic neuropeptide QRFP [Pipistrellus kuhlii]KAF6283142.1 pyroglutamylated RFamide peptide [Pipistrellus kuhlii]